MILFRVSQLSQIVLGRVLTSKELISQSAKYPLMVSLSNVPEVVYTNDQLIDRLFSYLNEGDIKEVVERTLDADSSNKAGGLKKIISLQYSETSSEEDETEFLRQLGPVGKFAILHGMLEEDNDIVHLEELNESSRQNLDDGAFVQSKGKISSSPINQLQELIEEVRPYLEMFDFDAEFEENDEEFTLNELQIFLNELDSGEDIYRVDPTSTGESDMVFSVNENDDIQSLVSEYTEYHVLGRVEHVYEQGEEQWLMNIMDLIPDEGRESRRQRRLFIKQMAQSSSELLDQTIDESDFKVGYPDIRVRVMAIYLY